MQGKAFFLLTACVLPSLAWADSATETALRGALQQATTQIAALENQVANLQAAQAPDTAMIEALKAQVQTLQKGGAAPAAGATQKPETDKELAAIRRQLAARNAAFAKSQSAYATAMAAVDAKASANTLLTSQLTSAGATIKDCDNKNALLFHLGNQILDAYAHKDDIFSTIANREPFIGFKRVELQNIVQNDQQAMLENQIAPSSSGQ